MGKTSKPALDKKLIKQFADFLEYAPPARLSRNLRNMLILYILYEKDGLPIEIEDLLIDLHELFRLLDVAEECNQTSIGRLTTGTT